MKKTTGLIISFFLLNFSFTKAGSGQRNIHVLFIGNSYTYTNDLPGMIDSLAVASGNVFIHSQYTPGGYSFYEHSKDAQTISIIHQQQWDYVVLQEQSQKPSLEPVYVDTAVIPYLLFLDSLIKINNPCTQLVMYETWGRRYGDTQNCSFYSNVCTYNGMQQRLKESYKIMADTVKGIVSPVGEAFRKMIQVDSTVVLYQSDNSHPSAEGTYLAACVFHEIFFHDKTNGNTYKGGLSTLLAGKLQLAGSTTVTDTLNTWNIGINEPWAQFSWSQLNNSGLTAFYGMADSSFSHFWDFGDSTSSILSNPIHQYTYSKYFPVKHIVCNNCICDTFNLVNNIVTFPSEVKNIVTDNSVKIFPNPITDNFINVIVSGNQINIPEFFTIDGRKIEVKYELQDGVWKCDLTPLSKGVYFLQIKNKENYCYKRIVKN